MLESLIRIRPIKRLSTTYTLNHACQSKACIIVMLLFVSLPSRSQTTPAAKVEGVVSDISEARISNARVIFRTKIGEFRTTTRGDGTYSLGLEPGKDSLEVQSSGFCSLQRAAFILHKTAVVKFDL